jgi:hypothetical protein
LSPDVHRYKSPPCYQYPVWCSEINQTLCCQKPQTNLMMARLSNWFQKPTSSKVKTPSRTH